MPIEIFTTGTDDYGQYIKALICGAPGAGKTLLSSTFPNPFYASAEGGLMSVASRRVKGTKLTSTDQLRELRGLLDQDPDVREGTFGAPVETVVIDTIDEIQRILVKERMATKRLETMDIAAWGWLGDQMRAILRSFRNLEMNVVFTCHLKESTDATTGQIFVKPALQGAVGDEIAQYMDLALLLRSETKARPVNGIVERYEERYLQTYKDPAHDWIKDRSGRLDPEVPINFEDDYTRIHAAIFGSVDIQATEQAVVAGLEKIAEESAPSTVESAPEKTPEALPVSTVDAEAPTLQEDLQKAATARSEPAEVEEPAPAEVSPEPEAEPDLTQEPEVATPLVNQEEPLKVTPEVADNPEPVLPPSVPATDDETGPWTCADCGDEFDSFDQKELSEIMMRRPLDAKCYRAAVDAKKNK